MSKLPTRQTGFSIAKREGTDLYILLHGDPMRCNLNQLYQAYRAAPHRLDDIVRSHLNALRKVPPTPAPLTQKEATEFFTK